MKPNFLDRAITIFSPEAGLKRLHARTRLDLALRAFEGASKGRRTENWRTSGASANAELLGSLPLLRARSRDLARNNGYGVRAMRGIASNTVGVGIVGRARGETKSAVSYYQSAWTEWADSVACDAAGNTSFGGLQALVMRTVAESGACLVRRRRRRSTDGLPVPLQLQVLEPDYLDASKDGLALTGGNQIINGIEFDRRGRRVAYWLYEEHPGESFRIGVGPRSNRIPAEDVAHVFRTERPGQVTGIPWLSPCVIRLRDLDEFEDATLIRQKIAACFVGFVHDIEAPEVVGSANEDMGRVEPGMLRSLPAGKDITFGNPPTADGNAEHVRQILRGIAVGVGVTYELLTGDYSQVNFSSGRMGWIEFQRELEQWQWHMLVPQLNGPVWRWFREAAIISGAPEQPVRPEWTAPRREMIDPVKETEASKSQVKGGMKSLSEAIREQGNDPDTVFEEAAAEKKKLAELGLSFDSIVEPQRPAS